MTKPLPRRQLLSGGMAATAALGGFASAALAAPAGAAARLILSAPDRATLARLDATPGDLAQLTEPGRGGLFRYGPLASAALRDDPLGGLSVAGRSAGAGWSRLWDETHGRPEWFGARANDPGFDCAPALEACHAACPVTQLGQLDYFVQRTVRLRHSWRTMRGYGRYATNERQGTRIILQQASPTLATDDIVLLGHASRPAELTTESHLIDLSVVRDGACAPHPSRDPARYPAGVRAGFLARCTISGVASLESSVGFNLGGLVYCKVDDCFAQRTRPGVGDGADLAIGFFIDGRVQFGYPGGNASLYLDRCIAAEQHPRHVDPAGLVALGAFVDSFIDRFESARIDTGMAFRVAGARQFGATIDLHVRNPVLDGCGRVGLDLDLDATASAAVEIVDPYVTPAGGRGDRGIAIRDGAGLVTITGGQILGDFKDGSLFISRTRGLSVHGLKIAQAARPVVVGPADGLQLEPQISNLAKTSTAVAIECRGVSRARIAPTVIGFGQPAFAGGVSLDSTSHHVAVDGSAIDPACFAGAGDRSARKVVFDGADARRAAGFAAAGNVLLGVVD